MQIPDPHALRRAFINSSRSKAASMSLPSPWPPARATDVDFLGWTDPKAPRRAYLALNNNAPSELVAIELRLPSVPPTRTRKTMCDLCHSVDAPGGALLMVAPRAGSRGRAGDSVGIYVCADFACSLRAREPLKEQQRSVSGLPDTRVDDLVERVTAFVERVRS